MSWRKSSLKVWLVVLVVLGAVGAVGLFWGRPAFRAWKHDGALRGAQRALVEGDLRAAALNARRALEANPGSLEACRVMAEVTEGLRLPVALSWRQRVFDLAPGVFSNRLALARAAVLVGDYPRAAEVLAQSAVTNQGTAAFHQMAAMVQMGLNNIAGAERHFGEVIRLEPTNKLAQLNRAIIQLQSKDQQIVAGAMGLLQELYQDPVCRRDALRHLVLGALRNKEFMRAATFSRELQAEPQATLDDRLLHLQALQESDAVGFETYLGGLKTECAKSAEAVNVLAGWLLAHGLPEVAQAWLEQLPAAMQAERPVLLARADAFMARKDWKGQREFLRGANWGDLDFLRQALLACALRELRQELHAESEWRAAIRAATDRPKQLSALTRMAGRWGWEPEKEELLWILVQRHPAERWALEALNQIYTRTGNTRGLHKVYSTVLDRNPDDVVAKNNFASLSLLLNMQTAKAHQYARDAWLRATNNAAFASTYAYSLHLQGRNNEGLAVLDALRPEQLTNASVALYYGTLCVTNDPAKALRFLGLAESGQLFPEEKALLTEMRRRL